MSGNDAPVYAAQSAPAAPTAPAGYSAGDIQKLYTDSLKSSDVNRALKGVKPAGPNGLYSLEQLQGLNPKWMTQRSRTDWQSALSGLGTGSQPIAQPGTAPNSSQYDLTVPYASLANNPGFQMMAKNAGYGNSITPMEQANATGWNRSTSLGMQPQGGDAQQSQTMPTPSGWGQQPNSGQMTNWVSQNWGGTGGAAPDQTTPRPFGSRGTHGGNNGMKM